MIYLQAIVHLKENQQERFGALMPEFAKLAAAAINFRLFAAYKPVTGRLNTYINIWQVPDANSLINLPNELPKHPDLLKLFGHVQECIAEETFELLTAAPYAG